MVFMNDGMTMSTMQPNLEPGPVQNHLLAALTAEAQQRLFPQLERVPMALALGMGLYESGDTL